MKKVILFLTIAAVIHGHAGGAAPSQADFSGTYWGLYVPRPKPSADSNRREYIAVVISFQEDTLTIVSASQTYKTRYTIEDGTIKYPERNGRSLINRRLHYDPKCNLMYFKKPGYWYIIPEKIIYHPLQAEAAQKVIAEFQAAPHHHWKNGAERP